MAGNTISPREILGTVRDGKRLYGEDANGPYDVVCFSDLEGYLDNNVVILCADQLRASGSYPSIAAAGLVLVNALPGSGSALLYDNSAAVTILSATATFTCGATPVGGTTASTARLIASSANLTSALRGTIMASGESLFIISRETTGYAGNYHHLSFNDTASSSMTLNRDFFGGLDTGSVVPDCWRITQKEDALYTWDDEASAWKVAGAGYLSAWVTSAIAVHAALGINAGHATATGNYSMGNNSIIGVATGATASAAVNLAQASAFTTNHAALGINAGHATATGNYSMGNFSLLGLATGATASAAVNLTQASAITTAHAAMTSSVHGASAGHFIVTTDDAAYVTVGAGENYGSIGSAYSAGCYRMILTSSSNYVWTVPTSISGHIEIKGAAHAVPAITPSGPMSLASSTSATVILDNLTIAGTGLGLTVFRASASSILSASLINCRTSGTVLQVASAAATGYVYLTTDLRSAFTLTTGAKGGTGTMRVTNRGVYGLSTYTGVDAYTRPESNPKQYTVYVAGASDYKPDGVYARVSGAIHGITSGTAGIQRPIGWDAVASTSRYTIKVIGDVTQLDAITIPRYTTLDLTEGTLHASVAGVVVALSSASELVGKRHNDIFSVDTNAVGTYTVQATNTTPNSIVRNIEVHARDTQGAGGIRVSNGNIVEDCTVYVSGAGLAILASAASIVERCRAYNYGNATIEVNRSTLRDCYAFNTTGVAITTTAVNVAGLFENCEAHTSGGGFAINNTASTARYVNCVARTDIGRAVFMTRGQFYNCVFIASAAATPAAVVYDYVYTEAYNCVAKNLGGGAHFSGGNISTTDLSTYTSAVIRLCSDPTNVYTN